MNSSWNARYVLRLWNLMSISIFDCLGSSFTIASSKNPAESMDFTDSKVNDMTSFQNLTQNSYCRLCLEYFDENETQITINNQINNQFLEITQTTLTASENYSKVICDNCFELFKDFTILRRKLIDNQKTLKKIYNSQKENKKKLKRDEIFTSTKLDFEKGEVNQELTVSDEDLDELNTFEKLKFPYQKNDNKKHELEESEVNQELTVSDEDLDELNTFEKLKFPYHKNDNTKHDLEEGEVNLELTFYDEDETTTNGNLTAANDMKMCGICGLWCASSSYENHYERVHLNQRKYFCDHCGHSAFYKHHLIDHTRAHLKIRPFSCHICSATFTFKQNLKRHLAIHVGDFVCSIDGCSTGFNSKYALNLHKKKNHESFRCKCKRNFSNKFMLSQHQEQPCDNKTCHVCGKSFVTVRNLKIHLDIHQSPKFHCEICKKKFHGQETLKMHIKNMHNDCKEFHCQYCDAEFAKKASLENHIRVVHLKQKLPCKVRGCNESFSHKGLFKKHILAFHSDLGQTEVNRLMDEIKTMQFTFKDETENQMNKTDCE
ncbi:CLUMA_CG009626, isoform A [Clunio marinus]|uniref:CLUMA_CG009626, isoform A n=1 Tax=Clunio marinus TaxID=568069 RepID=A0A1J1I7D8_9DIPT|nr:CLUMA_CG009626, isoform A [Clunio marinus]